MLEFSYCVMSGDIFFSVFESHKVCYSFQKPRERVQIKLKEANFLGL